MFTGETSPLGVVFTAGLSGRPGAPAAGLLAGAPRPSEGRHVFERARIAERVVTALSQSVFKRDDGVCPVSSQLRWCSVEGTHFETSLGAVPLHLLPLVTLTCHP